MSASCSSSVSARPCIISPEEIKKMYPRSDYPSSDRAKKYTVHYLLALEQPEGTIIKFINDLATKNFERLFCCDVDFCSLTPLMLAVIMRKMNIITGLTEIAKEKKLLSRLFNCRDQYQWTPLHHAAISSEEIFEYLKNNGADTEAKNKFNGSPIDIKMLTTKGSGVFSDRSVVVLSGEGEKIPVSEIPSDRIKEILGIEEYRDFPYYSYSQLGVLRVSEVTLESELKALVFTPAIDRLISNPPRLIIQECKELAHIEMSKELIADQDIPFGEAIFTYGGEHMIGHHLHRSFAEAFNSVDPIEMYSAPPIFAHRMGNVGRYSNTGFPNAQAFTINYKGAPVDIFMSAGIKKGEKIIFDYGPQFPGISYGKQVLFRRDQMRLFFKDGVDSVLLKINEIKALELARPLSLKEFVNLNILSNRIYFCLNNPAAILDLHFSGIVDVSYWIRNLHELNVEIFVKWREKYSYEFWNVYASLMIVSALERELERYSGLKAIVGGWALSHFCELSLMQLLKALKLITQQLVENQDINWEDYLICLFESIRKYDWSKDISPPVGINAMRSAIKSYLFGIPKDVVKDILLKRIESLMSNKQFESHEMNRMFMELAKEYDS